MRTLQFMTSPHESGELTYSEPLLFDVTFNHALLSPKPDGATTVMCEQYSTQDSRIANKNFSCPPPFNYNSLPESPSRVFGVHRRVQKQT